MSWRRGNIPNRALWNRARKRALERDDYQCQYPGCRVRQPLEVHHQRPLDAGGSAYDLDNLLTLCKTHHVQIERQRRSLRRPKGFEAWNKRVAAFG